MICLMPLQKSIAATNNSGLIRIGNKTIERPSQRYPLGVASDATIFAGENMVVNGNNTQNMQGEFYAGHFLVGTSVNDTEDKNEYPSSKVNNFTDANIDLPTNLDPSLVSATAFSKSFTKIVARDDSMVGKNKEVGHYVMGTSANDDIPDSQLKSILNDDNKVKAFKNRAYQLNGKKAYLGDIDYFKDNKVSTQAQAISNVTNVSDYYANLTAIEYDADGNITGYKGDVHSDAIKSINLNSKAVNGSSLGVDLNGNVIQVNIDMDTTSTDVGVAVVDIDGAANDGLFQKAEGISINLLNYTAGKQKIPYIIFNFHNFKTFNFSASSTYSMRAYTPAQVKANAPVDNKYYPQTTAQYNARLDLTPADNTKVRYNSAAHVMNNFNTINGGDDAAITLNSNRGSEENYSFIGTILAPHTNIIIQGDSQYSFAGNVITNRSIYLDGNVAVDKAFGANFNADGKFPGTSDLESTTKVPRILSVTLPNGVNFSPENVTTNYVFQFSLNNNVEIDPESETMHRLDGRAFKNTFLIDQPAGTSNVLWSRMNDGKWKKYEPDGKNPLQPNKTSEAQTVELSIADVTEDLKTKDNIDNYDDQTIYNAGKIDGNYVVNGVEKAFIGWHLLHKNKFSFVVASASDDLSTMTASEIKAKYDNTITNYTLNVHGDLLVNYPKVFDFGTYTLGTSEQEPVSIAKGQINVENPFYMDWKLVVKNSTSGADLVDNPLLQEDATDFNVQLYSLKTGTDDDWEAGQILNIGGLLKGPETPLLTLDTQKQLSGDEQLDAIQPAKSMPFYKSDVNLKFHNGKADQYAKRPGKYKLEATWELSTADKVVDDTD